ncbi:hypothetical protein RDI58_012247 [Solanum bulbocastanum]|uniref:PhoD-like phosphatase metallophosphatase domain-containing protein n=1 Tax=Solanum bulbocastanum TaxID=147425 RepID=A0AAN8YIF5_SOLBU
MRWWVVLSTIVLLSCCSGSICLAPVSGIAFGSCANQSAPQPVWDAIIHFDPQVFIWMGDNIYGDIRHPFKLFSKERTIGTWKNVIGTWDDHDYGLNDAGKDFNQRLLLDFLDEPLGSTRDPLSSDGNILGDAQWMWLERELKGPPTTITIIVSSIQSYQVQM